MTFTGFSPWIIAAFGALAAGAIAALHLLRPRPNPRRIASTLLWELAAATARPRFLWERLRRMWSLLLCAVIAALLLCAVSPWGYGWAAPPRNAIIVLDADMAGNDAAIWNDLLTQTHDVLAARGPRDRFAFVVADPRPRILHHADQPSAAARTVLAALTPANGLADPRATRTLCSSLEATLTDPEIIWITPRPRAVAAAVSSTDQAERVQIRPPTRDAANGAIIAATAQPRDGRTDLVVTAAWFGDESATLALRLEADGATETLTTSPGALVRARFENVPTGADSVAVTLAEPAGISADNRVTVYLPDEGPIAIAPADDLPPALMTALDACGALSDTAASNFWARKTAADNIPAGDGIAVVVGGPQVALGAAALQSNAAMDLTEGLGWEPAPLAGGTLPRNLPQTLPLLEADDALLAAVQFDADGGRRLLLADALFADEGRVAVQPAFPLLIRRALNWLDRRPPSRAVNATRLIRDPRVTLGNAQLDIHYNAVSSDLRPDAAPPTPKQPAAWPLTATVVMLLLAAALVFVDAWLHSRGRMV